MNCIPVALDIKSPAVPTTPTTAELPELYADVETYHDALERLTGEAIVAYHETRNLGQRFHALEEYPSRIDDIIGFRESRAEKCLIRVILTANTADLDHGKIDAPPKIDTERQFEAFPAAAILSDGRLYIANPIDIYDLPDSPPEKLRFDQRYSIVVLDLSRVAKVGAR